MNETKCNACGKIQRFLAKPFFRDHRTLLALWLLLGVIAAVTKFHSCNNFLIFRGVFWHTFQELPLYVPYPEEYFDINHYGPLFSLVIAPFAVVPEWIGLVLWDVALALVLFVAVSRSTLTNYQKLFIYWFCAHELLTALFMQQFNIAIAAIIVLTFMLIEKEKDFWAACLIVLGTLVKLYGIVGLAFFFFSKHKGKFVVSLLFWSVVLFCLPMVVSSTGYIVDQHVEWMNCLVGKNMENHESIAQNISMLGLIQRCFHIENFSNMAVIAPALVLFLLPYLRFSQYKNEAFRQTLLASVLLFTVLFSTGSESSSYIIALVGVIIWYTACPWKRTWWEIFLLVFAFILTSLSPSDLFPAYLRKTFVQPYALKALPCAIIWLQLCYEMLTKDYTTTRLARNYPPEAT